jgi:hypothetical protein
VYCEVESEYNQREEREEISKVETPLVVEKFLKDSYKEELKREQISEYTQRLLSFFKLLQEIDKNQSKISDATND